MRRFFRKSTALNELRQRLQELEEKVSELEKIADERDSLWLFIEEMRSQEVEGRQAIQEELENTILRSFKPQGDA